VVVVSDVGLTELVQNRPGPLGIDSRYLCHDLAIVYVAALNEFSALRLLVGTDLGGAPSLVSVVVLPILSIGLIGSVVPICTRVADGAILLVIGDPVLLEKDVEETQAVSITRVEPVPPELSHLALSHVLDFLHLRRCQLNLCWVDCAGGTHVALMRLLSWLHVTIVIVIFDRRWICFAASSLSILLGDSSLELVDGSLLEFLAHELLISEPGILLLALLIDKSLPSGWCLRWLILALGISMLRIGCSHIEHDVVEVVNVILILLLIIIIASCLLRWIFQLHIYDLVFL
jgi:hypothetical protein